jgi:hypothetical protein
MIDKEDLVDFRKDFGKISHETYKSCGKIEFG